MNSEPSVSELSGSEVLRNKKVLKPLMNTVVKHNKDKMRNRLGLMKQVKDIKKTELNTKIEAKTSQSKFPMTLEKIKSGFYILVVILILLYFYKDIKKLILLIKDKIITKNDQEKDEDEDEEKNKKKEK
tara:strand:+ start:454 stop:840 length:387 start_codon:yes stop_codon:yes gene_type:complete